MDGERIVVRPSDGWRVGTGILSVLLAAVGIVGLSTGGPTSSYLIFTSFVATAAYWAVGIARIRVEVDHAVGSVAIHGTVRSRLIPLDQVIGVGSNITGPIVLELRPSDGARPQVRTALHSLKLTRRQLADACRLDVAGQTAPWRA